MPRPAIDIVHDYIFKIWNEGQVELVRELCADPIIRHEPNAVVPLSHEEQVERIRHSYADLKTVFEDVVFSGDEEYVTLVWNVTGQNPDWKLCGIEIFRVIAGRITEVWNLPYADGSWGMTRRLTERSPEGVETDAPILSATLDGQDWQLEVPLDARNIGRWLRPALGRPISDRADADLWRHRYETGADPVDPLTLVMRDRKLAPLGLNGVVVQALALRLVPSAVVNATVSLRGTPAPAPIEHAVGVGGAHEVVRLAKILGAVSRSGSEPAAVRDADIRLHDGGASGGLTLDLPHGDPSAFVGDFAIRFGWRQGDLSLIFEAQAVLDNPEPIGPAEAGAAVRYQWRADHILATLVNDVPPLPADDEAFASIEVAD